jgi:DNA polymerase-1
MKVHYLYIDHPEDFQNKEMLLLLNTHTTYAGHNLLFDIPFLLKNNVLNKEEFMHSSASYTLFDTMNVMANVDNLSPSLKPKTLGRKLFQIVNNKEILVKQYMSSHKIQDYSKVPREIMTPYAVEDIRLTALLYLYELVRINKNIKDIKDFSVYYIIRDNTVLETLIRMKMNGIKIDKERLESLTDEMYSKHIELSENLKKSFTGMNYNSTAQLVEYCQKNNIRLKKRSKTGVYSMDKSVIEDLDKRGHKEFGSLLEERKVHKLLSTYLKNYSDNMDSEGYLHGNFNLAFARTTRLTSSNPNLQNISRIVYLSDESVDLRGLFIAPEGYSLVTMDYSQIELRLFTYYAKCKRMQEAFDKGIDLHTQTAKDIFDVHSIEKVTKRQRGIAKTINFGLLYGMQAKTLSKRLGVDTDTAESYLMSYHKAYPELIEVKNQLKTIFFARERLTDKRKGFIINACGHFLYLNKVYTALNYLIQSTGSDIMKAKMLEIEDLLVPHKSKMILTIHDELGFYIHKSEEGLIDKIKDIMEAPVTFRDDRSVSFPVDVDVYGDRWASKS